MIDIKKGINKFYIGDTEENPLAQIVLTDDVKDVISIEHTYVYEQLKGQGAGKLLIKKVLDFAIVENKKIIPLYSFAKKVDKNGDDECVLCFRGLGLVSVYNSGGVTLTRKSINYYQSLIIINPNYEHVDIFEDKESTGTIEYRTDFQKNAEFSKEYSYDASDIKRTLEYRCES